MAMVGYIDCAAIGAVSEITEEQVKSYNVVIFCFANADGTIPTTPPYQDFINEVVRIKQWENTGTINLLSIGGAIGNVDISPKAIDNTVNNLMQSMAELSLDGIDVDIELPHIPITDILAFSQRLRYELDEKAGFLTCSPILAGSNAKPTLNTPNGGPSWEPIYSPSGVVFDAINVQAYNSGDSFLYLDPATKELVSEASANIIRAAYSALEQRGNIHPKSRIVIGVPCDHVSANEDSNCWNPDYSINKTAKALVDNVQDIKQEKYHINNRAFGGLMTWSMSNDAFFSNPPGYFSANVASKVLALHRAYTKKELA